MRLSRIGRILLDLPAFVDVALVHDLCAWKRVSEELFPALNFLRLLRRYIERIDVFLDHTKCLGQGIEVRLNNGYGRGMTPRNPG